MASKKHKLKFGEIASELRSQTSKKALLVSRLLLAKNHE